MKRINQLFAFLFIHNNNYKWNYHTIGYNVSIYRLNKSKQISTIFALYVDSLLDYKCIFALYEMMKKRKCFNQLHEIAIKKRELPTRSTA